MKFVCSFPAYLVLTLSTVTILTPATVAEDHPGHTSQSAPDKLLPEASRKPAPSFSLTDANGKAITLSEYRGKVVLLDFWATWCGGCKLEIPWYMEFDKKYRRQGLAVIGVSMDEDGWKAVKPFLARKTDPETGGNTAMEYPVVIGSDQLAKEYNLTSMPMTLLIDRQGKIALSHTGVVNKNDFEGHILQLLNQAVFTDRHQSSARKIAQRSETAFSAALRSRFTLASPANLYLRVMQHNEGTWEIQCVSQQILLSGFGGRKAPSRMGKISTAEVLRLRATSAVSRDKSVRRSAQDDDSVGVSTKNIPNKLALMGPALANFQLASRDFSEGLSHRSSLRLVEPIDWPYCLGDGWKSNGAK